MRETFVASATELLADPRTTIVLADISAAAFAPAARRYPTGCSTSGSGNS